MLDGGRQIDVVRADARGDRQFQPWRLRDPLRGQVGRLKGLRNDDIRVGELALEDRAVALLVRSNH
jgi:hypothetical protein